MKNRFGLIVFLCISANCFSQQKEVCHIIRDHKTPLSHIVDPATAPNIWLMTTDEQSEMPMPTGINESLRKRIDAERTSLLNKERLLNRGILNDNPTNPESITTKAQRGIEVPPGGGTPNDNHIAVGNDGKIVSVMNTVIRVHNDTGKIIKAFTLDFFANNPNIKKEPIPTMNRTYDPRVIYDPYQDRYIVVFMHGTTDKNSFIVVGFSSSNDPSKPWYVYKVPGTPIQDSVWSDYPIVSQTKEDMFFTVNLLHNGSSWEEGFVEAVIWQINKDDGFKGDTIHKNFFHNIKYEGVSIWSICAIQNGPMPNGIDNYFLSVRPYSQKNDTVFVHRITNTQKSGLANYELGIFKSPLKYGFPSSALQPDTAFRLRTNDARVLSGIRIGSQVHYFQNCMNFKTLQAHIMHGAIYNLTLPSGANVTGSPWQSSALLKAQLFTHDTLDFGYPAVAAAGKEPSLETDVQDPSMVVTSVYSGSNSFPGTGVFYINRYGEYSQYQSIKKGQSIIAYTFIKPKEQRWGDYEGIQAKFNEKGIFYLVGSWGKQKNMHAFVARVKIEDTVYDNPIERIRIFPVPSTQNVNIEFQVNQESQIEGYIYTIDGKLIDGEPGQETESQGGDLGRNNYPAGRPKPSFRISVGPGTHRYAIHSFGLSKGVYFVKLSLNEGSWSSNEKEENNDEDITGSDKILKFIIL